MDLAVGRWDPIGWPETSVRNYHYSLRNSPNERSSLVLCLFHHTSQVINIYQWFTCTLRYKYRGADKSLADLLPDVFCLMVRIFRLMLPRWTPLSKVRHPLPRWTPLSKVRHPLPRWTPLSKVRPPLPRWTPLSKVRHPLPRWTPLSKVRHPLPRWTPLSKVRHPFPPFHDTHHYLVSLCGDLLYRILSKSDENCGNVDKTSFTP